MKTSTAKATYSDLPSDPAKRREFLVDVLGQHLFSLRNQLAERLRQRVESEDLRGAMGTIPSRPYSAIARLEAPVREAALDLAREATDEYMKLVLGLLESSGQSLRLGSDHAIRYRLYAEVIGVEDYDNVLAESVINRQAEKALADYFGMWLNRHGDHR